MKKSTIITIICFALGIFILTAGFVLLTDNEISKGFKDLFTTTGNGGGGDGETYEPMDFFKVDVSQYITLGQYKDIVLEVDQIEVSQEEIDDRINVLLAQVDEFTKVREGNITEKVIFSFDYTGYYKKSDGTRGDAFDGGAGTDQLAYIDGDTLVTIYDTKTGTFIDGFAQGIIGAAVGSNFTIDVTFPTNYGNSLAGQKVEFDIKINYIAETHFTDAWVKEYTNDQHKTTDEFVQYLKDSVNPQIKDANIEALWVKIAENATLVEVPKQQYDYLSNAMKEEVEGYVTYSQYYFGKQLDYLGVLKELGFKDEADFEKYVDEYAKSYVKSELVLHAVMQAENITVTDEEYRIFMDTLMESTGKTEAALLEQYGEEKIRQTIAFENLDIFIFNANKFVVKDGE
jgi:trigger factor